MPSEMSHLPGSVSEGDFHYAHGSLFVKSPSVANSYKRAAVTELDNIFNPKPGQPRPLIKDRPAPWYEAQLLHYGLPAKPKSTAVKRLRDAVNSRTLAVPSSIENIEDNLKKRWDEAGRKAKKDTATIRGDASFVFDETADTSAKKRKHGSAVASLGGGGVSIMGEDGVPSIVNLQAVIQSSTAPSTLRAKRAKTDKTNSEPTNNEKEANKENSHPTDLEKSTSKLNAALSSLAQISQMPTPTTSNMHVGPSNTPLGKIEGIYDIKCQWISEDWSDVGRMTLSICLDTRGMWFGFDFGIFEGVMHCKKQPKQTGEEVKVDWRGRETGEGEIQPPDDDINKGWVKFLGEGSALEGAIHIWGEDHYFTGIKYRQTIMMKQAKDYKKEWKSLDWQSYEREGEARGNLIIF